MENSKLARELQGMVGHPKDREYKDMVINKLLTCSSPRRAVLSHSLVCSENSLLIVGIGPILNKELELIFRSDRSDRSDRTCVYS